MGKVIAGVASAILAAGWLLYGLGCESTAHDVWLLAKIPALGFLGVEIPRVFVLGCAVMWLLGGVKLIADGLGEAIFVRAFVAGLRAGVPTGWAAGRPVAGVSTPAGCRVRIAWPGVLGLAPARGPVGQAC
jgi:hypothetical protein